MSMKYNGSATLGRGTTSPLTTSPTGTRYGVALTGELKPMQTGGRWGAETPKCPKCGKSVYFAEQVRVYPCIRLLPEADHPYTATLGQGCRKDMAQGLPAMRRVQYHLGFEPSD